LPGGGFRAVVGDGRGLDYDAGLRQQGHDGIAHFFRGFHPRKFGGSGRGERCWSAHEQHASAAPQSGFGQGVSHSSARAVGEIAHGIDLLPRRASGDQYGLAAQILRRAESFHHGSDDGFILSEAPRADHAAGQVSRAWFDDPDAALVENLEIRLRCRMIPHVDVHRGRDHDWRSRREIQSGQEIAGNALRELRDHIRSSGHDDEGINRLCDRNVLDGRIQIRFLPARGKHSCDDFFSGKGSEGEGADELLSGAGHDDLHADAAILQQANDFGGLIGCDAAGDTEGDLHDMFDC
jgi:hypothetical protein